MGWLCQQSQLRAALAGAAAAAAAAPGHPEGQAGGLSTVQAAVGVGWQAQSAKNRQPESATAATAHTQALVQLCALVGAGCGLELAKRKLPPPRVLSAAARR